MPCPLVSEDMLLSLYPKCLTDKYTKVACFLLGYNKRRSIRFVLFANMMQLLADRGTWESRSKRVLKITKDDTVISWGIQKIFINYPGLW